MKKTDKEYAEFNFIRVLVTDGDNYYQCVYMPNRWKCGKCLRGVMKVLYPYPYTCRVCGAKFNKAYYEKNGELHVFFY